MKTVTVKITREFIKDGVPCNETCCPIALGIEAAVGFVAWLKFSGRDLVWRPAWRSRLVPRPLSKQAYAFAKTFDKGGPVEPFQFDLKVPKRWPGIIT